MQKNRNVIFKDEDIFKHINQESIYIENFFNTKVNLLSFKKIKHLVGYYNQMINLDKAITIETLTIWGCNNKSKQDLFNLINLNSLVINQGNISNLDFLIPLNKLKSLQLNHLSKLTDVSSLNHISKNLKTLEIESCKKIESLDVILKNLKNLRILKLIGMQISNIAWVEQLPCLKQLIITNSNILSGDIHPAKDIEYVAIDNKRHYNYRFDDNTMKIMPK